MSLNYYQTTVQRISKIFDDVPINAVIIDDRITFSWDAYMQAKTRTDAQERMYNTQLVHGQVPPTQIRHSPTTQADMRDKETLSRNMQAQTQVVGGLTQPQTSPQLLLTAGRPVYEETKKTKQDAVQLKLRPSMCIASAAYWRSRNYLLVNFVKGGCYSYSAVDRNTIELWQYADSAGSFFYYNIRMNFRYQRQ